MFQIHWICVIILISRWKMDGNPTVVREHDIRGREAFYPIKQFRTWISERSLLSRSGLSQSWKITSIVLSILTYWIRLFRQSVFLDQGRHEVHV